MQKLGTTATMLEQFAMQIAIVAPDLVVGIGSLGEKAKTGNVSVSIKRITTEATPAITKGTVPNLT